MHGWHNLLSTLLRTSMVVLFLPMMLACTAQGADLPGVQTISHPIGNHTEPGVKVVRSAEAWQALWHSLEREPEMAFDPQHQDAVVIFLGMRSTSGYGIDLVSADVANGNRVICWQEKRPNPKAPVSMVITSPYLVATFPKVPGEVQVESTAPAKSKAAPGRE